MSMQSTERHRHWAIYILVVLALIAGILAFRDAARYMGWLPITQNIPGLGEIRFAMPSPLWFSAIFSAVVGIFYFVVAWLLWVLNPLGLFLAAFIAALGLFTSVLAVLGTTPISAVALPFLVNLAVLILALIGMKAAIVPRRQVPETAVASEPKPASPGDDDLVKMESSDSGTV